MESFAIEQDINLEKGWKVEFAKQVKSQLLKLKKEQIPAQLLEKWKELFQKFD